MSSADRLVHLVQQNRLAEARQYLERADDSLAGNPKVERARAILAYREGRIEDAIRIMRQLLDEYPGPDEATILGWLFTQAERFEEASEQYRCFLREWPDHASLWSGFANNLEYLGETEEALHAWRRAVDLDPDAGVAWFRLTMLNDYAWLHDRREQLLAPVSVDRELNDRYGGEFAAGRYLEHCGEWDEAFRRLQRANELRRKAGGLNIRKKIAAAQTVMADWVAQDWTTALPGEPSPAPIFIVGMPRSGTSLLEQILDSHPDVQGIGEQPYLAQEVTRTLKSSREPVARLDWREAGRRYLERVRQMAGDAPRFTDKMMHNFNSVGFIRCMFPNARVIYCRRDVLDNCMSCYRANFNTLTLSYNLQELGWFYGYHEGMMEFWRAQFPDAVIEVQYESMVNEPREQVERLLNALDLPWAESCMKFHENPRVVRTASVHQVRQRIYTSSIGRAEPYRRHLEPLLEAVDQARDWMRPPVGA